MKSLQEYILESIDNDINEGEIWDAIKNWFKNLFEPSNNYEFDRYNIENKLSGINLTEYQEYLEDNFDIKNIILKEIDKKDLKTIVYPNGEEPNKDGEIGFYNFIDNVNEKKDNTKYFGLIYKEKNKVKDISCLINYINNDETLEILKIQILKEFINIINLNDIIKLLINCKDFIGSAKNIILKENSQKEIYKQLINDCEFEKEYDKESNQNIAIKRL